MDSSSIEVSHDFSPMIKVYKDGRVERLKGFDVVPPSFDPETNVESKDVVISKDEEISARIFIPKLNDPNEKLPLLVNFHGGGFCINSPFTSIYHKFMNSIVSKAHIVGISVTYKRAPEHPIPVAYEDSWASLKWVASHFDGQGPEELLNRHADLGNVFLSGDSAGATIAHHMALRVGTKELSAVRGIGELCDYVLNLKLEGIVLVHPYFWGTEQIGDEDNQPELVAFMEDLWCFVCPTTTGCDDPLINPAKEPNLEKLAYERVLICVAENDVLKDRGWYYK